MGNLLRRMKWIALLAMIGGPILAYVSFTEAQDIRRVATQGAEAPGIVETITEKTGRRGSKSYTAVVHWQDASGAARTSDIKLSDAFAESVIVGEGFKMDAVTVKYLKDDTKAPVVLANDAGQQIDDDMLAVYIGAAAGVIGLLGSAFAFLRRKPA